MSKQIRTHLRVPVFVRMRTPPWGSGGSEFSSYIAALLDRADLRDARVLGVDGNTDLLLDVINRGCEIGTYVAVEPELVTAAFFSSYLDAHDVRLVITDLVDDTDAALAEIGSDPDFDVIIVRSNAFEMTRERLEALLTVLGTLASGDAKVLLTLALSCRASSGEGAVNYLLEQGHQEFDQDYVEIDWVFGTIPLYAPTLVDEIATERGWSVDEICEPRRGFPQHHLVLSRTP